ncbi:zinc finger protein 252-like isoform X2 [Engraulis encrasicolus]|uniref:zinc finger protein 252-like isoform X2 n=1 Tax=Engraulis encrasicolus TaxID=184585 RepID=UPI002FD64820
MESIPMYPRTTKIDRLNERVSRLLTAAVNEVLELVRDTVSEYQEKTSRTQRENERLRKRLRTSLKSNREAKRASAEQHPLPTPEEQQQRHLDIKPDDTPAARQVSDLTGDDVELKPGGAESVDTGGTVAKIEPGCTEEGPPAHAPSTSYTDTDIAADQKSTVVDLGEEAELMILENGDTCPLSAIFTDATQSGSSPQTSDAFNSPSCSFQISEVRTLQQQGRRGNGRLGGPGSNRSLPSAVHQKATQSSSSSSRRLLRSRAAASSCQPMQHQDQASEEYHNHHVKTEPPAHMFTRAELADESFDQGEGLSLLQHSGGGLSAYPHAVDSSRDFDFMANMSSSQQHPQISPTQSHAATTTRYPAYSNHHHHHHHHQLLQQQQQQVWMSPSAHHHPHPHHDHNSGQHANVSKNPHPPSSSSSSTTGTKKHVCPVCGRSFSGSGDLNKHVRIHTGEKPYACTTCGKRFRRADHLQTHRRVHTGEKPYVCPVCGQRFSVRTTLQKHRLTHGTGGGAANGGNRTRVASAGRRSGSARS